MSKRFALMAVIAATYSITTLVSGSLGYSWVQVRISEALTPLPFLMGFPAVAGLTLGCVVANMFSPVGLPDIIIGPTLTFLAGYLSWKANFGKRIVACAYPVLINAFGVSAYVSSFYHVPYIMTVFTISVGEFIAAVLIGYPLLRAVERTSIIKRSE